MKSLIIRSMGAAAILAAARVLADTETVDGIRWTYVVSGGEAAVGGVGDNPQAIPTDTTGEIIIPTTLGGYPVTSIRDRAFNGCEITGVTVPGCIKSIGDDAFRLCAHLATVTIGDGVENIGINAFSSCGSLESIAIPDSVTEIGSSAFCYCRTLKRAEVKGGIKNVPYYLFAECYQLEEVSLSNGLTNILHSAFAECPNLWKINIPDSVESIGWNVFYNCSNALYNTTSIRGVRMVDGWVIGYTDELRDTLTLTGVRGIADSAFWDSWLTSVTIPGSVKNVGGSEYSAGGIFDGCSALKSLVLSDGVLTIGRLGNMSALESVVIPNTVTSIGYSAFYDCTSLTEVTIPASVKRIGDSAFGGCASLTNIVFKGNAPEAEGTLFYSQDAESCVGTIPVGSTGWGIALPGYWHGLQLKFDESLSGDTSGRSWDYQLDSGEIEIRGVSPATGDVTIPATLYGYPVTTIHTDAFRDNTGLTSVTIPNGVTNIGESAFRGCTGLVGISLPSSITMIPYGAFQNCAGLTSVTIPASVTSKYVV